MFHLVLFRNGNLNSTSIRQSPSAGRTYAAWTSVTLQHICSQIYVYYICERCQNPLSSTASVTEEERAHQHLETGCPCQPSELVFTVSDARLTQTTYCCCQQLSHIERCGSICMHPPSTTPPPPPMHGTATGSHQQETEREARAEQIGCCVKGERGGGGVGWWGVQQR